MALRKKPHKSRRKGRAATNFSDGDNRRAVPFQQSSSTSLAKNHEAHVATAATATNDRESPFLLLPAELRNQIYWHLFTASRPYTFAKHEPSLLCDGTHTVVKVPMSRRERRNFSLVRVCRRIHHETSLLPFVLNAFRCNSLLVLAHLPSLFNTIQRSGITVFHLVTNIFQIYKLQVFAPSEDPFSTLLPGVRHVVVHLAQTWRDTRAVVRYRNRLRAWLNRGDNERLQITWEGPWPRESWKTPAQLQKAHT